jgi:anti-sigma B factor antagonist
MLIFERRLSVEEFLEGPFEPLVDNSFLGAQLHSRKDLQSVGFVLVVDLSGDVAGAASEELYKRVQQIVERGDHTIVLNFAEVTLVDSSGLGEIVRSFTTVFRSSGFICIVNAPDHFRELLQRIKLL